MAPVYYTCRKQHDSLAYLCIKSLTGFATDLTGVGPLRMIMMAEPVANQQVSSGVASLKVGSTMAQADRILQRELGTSAYSIVEEQ
jgi:hypothetical protein